MESKYLKKIIGIFLYVTFLYIMFALGVACHDAKKNHETQVESNIGKLDYLEQHYSER